MKRQITILSLLLFITTTIISCKKDDSSLKARMLGKWMISKIVVSGYPEPAPGSTEKSKNGTFTYGTTADYVDFKPNNDDQVEISLSSNRTIGTYLIVYEDQFTMDLNDGVNYATVNSINTTQFQFTSKIDKTNVTKIYYLTK